MRKTPKIPPGPSELGAEELDIAFVALPGAQLLDIVGPLEAFDMANRVLAARGQGPRYRSRVLGIGARMRSKAGMELRVAPLAEAAAPDTLIVGGALSMIAPGYVTAPAALADIGRLAEGARRVASVCVGAFVLGELGWLDGRPCATHWYAAEALQRRFPAARVDADALTIEAAPVFTAAGATAGMDLALFLIERDLGSAVALAVARMLVVFLHRPGGQSQFGVALELRSGVEQRLRELIAEVVAAPGLDHRVPRLAARVDMSPRNFARVFREQTGETPGAFVTRVRIEAARRRLELSDASLAAVAEGCGFGTEEGLRRAFQRHLGVAPGAYRARFRRRDA